MPACSIRRRKLPTFAGWLNAERTRTSRPNGHDHDERITRFADIRSSAALQGVGMWLELLIQTRGKDLLRSKAFSSTGPERGRHPRVQHVLHRRYC